MIWLVLALSACVVPVTEDPADLPSEETDDPAVEDTVDTPSETPADTVDTPAVDTPADTVDTPADTVDTPVDTDPPVDSAAIAAVIPPALANVNLLVNPGGELGDQTGWEVLTAGGDGFDAMAGTPHSGSFEFGTSYGQSERRQILDLVALGFTPAQLDAEPEVRVGEWLREVCATGDPYSVSVQLLTDQRVVLDEWGQSGVSAAPGVGCDYADDLWFELRHPFRAYGPGLRFIVFSDGGYDSEFWGGFYGMRFDDAWVSLTNAP